MSAHCRYIHTKANISFKYEREIVIVEIFHLKILPSDSTFNQTKRRKFTLVVPYFLYNTSTVLLQTVHEVLLLTYS